jgi:hypothetical protein
MATGQKSYLLLRIRGDGLELLKSIVRSTAAARRAGQWPSEPYRPTPPPSPFDNLRIYRPEGERLSDGEWMLLKRFGDLPEQTPNGIDVRAYLGQIAAKLRSGRRDADARPNVDRLKKELDRLLQLQIGEPMPRLTPAMAYILAGMAMLDRSVGQGNVGAWHDCLDYVYRVKIVTPQICSWISRAREGGACQRDHDRLHSRSSSLAEVAAASEFLNFLENELGERRRPWAAKSRRKKAVGTKNRQRIVEDETQIANNQVRLVRALLTLVGVRSENGSYLTLGATRQRMWRYQNDMRAGFAEGRGHNALWKFFKKRGGEFDRA